MPVIAPRMASLWLPCPLPRRTLLTAALGLALSAPAAAAALPGVEPLQRLDLSAARSPAERQVVALTLDACGGAYDARLIATLVRLEIPATVFVTQRWLDQNPEGLRELLAQPQLFELQNHGARHQPAVVGQRLYGMQGPSSLAGVEAEIQGGASAVRKATSTTPHWYRGAGARYDTESLALIDKLGYRVAGYSLNADDGASASASTVARRVQAAQAGDIILAHMNHPKSGTAQGLDMALPLLKQRGLQFVRLSQVAGVVPAARGPRTGPAKLRPQSPGTP
jgi:peptidoglycan/xylan/chitin deacetylase (PgdA/CDA1 family)